MKNLEQKIFAACQGRSAPLVLEETARVQDACRRANGAESACDAVQSGTTDVCQRCREVFAAQHGRQPQPLVIPQYMAELMTRG